MSEFLFTDYTPASPARPIIEKGRVFDIRDPKWAHPEFRGMWTNEQAAAMTLSYLPEMSVEDKRAASEANDAGAAKMFGPDKLQHTCDIEETFAPGCPEEPETQVKLRVYRPKTLEATGNRALLFLVGGGLVLTTPDFWAIERFCDAFNCVAVAPIYRHSYEAQYPAAVNDVHAAYQYMLDNADALAIDPNNIVITGQSTGAHLALALGFRLKRYGICPKGIVASLPQTDDRTDSNIYSGSWDSVAQRNALFQWMGENANSYFVGPEALANKATIADCIGFPPCFIHTAEFDPDRDSNREFYGKLLKARTYTEYHAWGGSMHETFGLSATTFFNGMDFFATPYGEVFKAMIDSNIETCYKYDLRRPWVVEDLKENGPWW